MYVYKITNQINNKIYIGITNDYKKRWSNHKRCSNPKMVIAKAIKKYGVQNFKFEILFSGLTIEEASNKEIELIKSYNCRVPNGYNVSKGGMSIIGNRQHFGENNSHSILTDEIVQYIKDHRDMPEYVLYDDFAEMISYEQFKKIYNDKAWPHIKTTTPIYPYNLQFSCQFATTNNLDYGEVKNLREQYANKIYWRDAYNNYINIFPNEWDFWNVYNGNRYSLVMPEVFTEELKHYHSGLSKKGSLNGRAKLTWEDVNNIRILHQQGVSNSNIYKQYPQVSSVSIRNIINNKTWIK